MSSGPAAAGSCPSRSAVAEQVQLGGDVAQRRVAGGRLLQRAQRLGGGRGRRPAARRAPARRRPAARAPRPARSPASSISAISSGRVNRRGLSPAPPAVRPAAAAARGPRRSGPARARCRTAATALAASTLTVAPGRSTRAIALIAAAGVLDVFEHVVADHQVSRVRADHAVQAGRVALDRGQPRARLGRAPLRGRERVRARVDDRDVVPEGRERHGEPAGARRPRPRCPGQARPVAATRAATTALSTSQTREERTPSRLKSTAMRASYPWTPM